MGKTEVTGTQIKDASVSLSVDVTGTLPVANGGTGSTTIALNNVVLGNGTGGVQTVAPGTSGNVLSSNGTTWVSAALPARSISTVTTDATTLGAAANTDYVAFANISGDASSASVVSLLHFNGANGSTTITDSALNPATWSVAGGPALTTATKKFGSAALSIPSNNLGAAYTSATSLFNFAGTSLCVECWINPSDTTNTSRGIFANSSYTDNIVVPFRVDQQGTSLRMLIGNAALDGWAVDITTSAVLTASTWHHIALTGDGTSLRLFCNGALLSTQTQPAWTSANRAMSYGFYANVGFVGQIDDVRITKGVARYTAAFSVPTAEFPDPTTITVPTAVGNLNRYTVKNLNAAPLTVKTTSSQLIDAASTATLTTGTVLNLISDNTGWRSV